MNVFDLFAKLSLDKSEYEEGLDDAEKDAEGFGSKLKKGLGTAGKIAGGAITAVGTASVALGKAFVSNMGDVASYGDSIDKMSQKIGISAEAYQEWDFIAQHSGTSMESLKASFKTLSTAAQNGSEEFEALGISLEDAASMSTEDLFSSVISGLQNMEEGTERTALASKLLGRGAIELGALLNTSAEDTEAMRQQVHDLGGVMSNEAVKSAAQYQDSLQNMQTALTGLKNNMMSEFLPAASQVMDGLAKVFSGDDSGMESIDQGIDNMISSITNSLPRLMEVGSNIITSLSKSIIANLPKLAKTAGDIVLTLASDLIKQLPALIESGTQIIMELALAIGEALPDLIPTIVEVILEIVDTLLDNIDMLVEGAIAIILGLAEGLINALPILIEKLPEIITSIVDALIENLPLLIDGAIQLVTLLVTHLPEIILALIEAIPQILTSIIEAFGPIVEMLGEVFKKAWEGIKKVFANVGGWFKEKFTKAKDSANEGFEGIKDKMSTNWENTKKVFEKADTWFSEKFTKAKDKTVNAWSNIKSKMSTVWQNIKSGFKLEDVGKWGQDMMDNFMQGIQDKIEALKEKLGKVAGTIKDFLGFSEPDKGPLSNFHTFAPDMMELFAKGIADNTDIITNQIKKSFDFDDIIVKGTPSVSGSLTSQPYVIENHIYLEGEAKGVFKLVREQNNIIIRSTGKNLLAET